MPELIHPLDREVRRRSVPRNDGFSDDELSYSAANDFGKLWGEAMAEYDARRKPRTDAFGKALPSESIADLRSELLDPIIQRFGTSSAQTPRAVVPRTYKVGNQEMGEKVISVNPESGETTEIYTSQPSPKAAHQDPRDLIDYRNASNRLEEAAKDYATAIPSRKAEAKKVLDEASTTFKALRVPTLNAAPTPGATNTPAAAEVSDELVSVTNPQGKPTRIKKSQFDKAEKLGYKRR